MIIIESNLNNLTKLLTNVIEYCTVTIMFTLCGHLIHIFVVFVCEFKFFCLEETTQKKYNKTNVNNFLFVSCLLVYDLKIHVMSIYATCLACTALQIKSFPGIEFLISFFNFNFYLLSKYRYV